jgi:hypothetical protein
LWTARAINSLPVPVSPVINTVESVGATLPTLERTVFSVFEEPTISSNMDARSTSSRNARFSCWSRSLSARINQRLLKVVDQFLDDALRFGIVRKMLDAAALSGVEVAPLPGM